MAGWLKSAPLLLCLLLGACASNRAVSFKINSEPEGSLVVYRLSAEKPGPGETNEWIFLGNTPLETVRHISTDALKEKNTVSLKIIRPGYFDQMREWDGESFWEAVEREKRILWAPQMVPQSTR